LNFKVKRRWYNFSWYSSYKNKKLKLLNFGL